MKFSWRLDREKGVRSQEPGFRTGPAPYESVTVIESRLMPGVRFTVARMSFDRRVELMRRIRELARRAEFLAAGSSPEDKMDAALVQAEIERMYVCWGVRAISGLVVDGLEAGPERLSDAGPEELFREALAAVRAEIGLDEEQRKNS